jgi:C_GCAxxG_C_C family probable redox protein
LPYKYNKKLIEEAGKRAADKYCDGGFNCAETLIFTLAQTIGGPIKPEMTKLVTGFGGGVGRSGDICGAIVGGVVALNTFFGRTKPDEDKTKIYQLAAELLTRFKEKFSSTCCETLNKNDFTSKVHKKRCSKIIGETTKITAELLLRK